MRGLAGSLKPEISSRKVALGVLNASPLKSSGISGASLNCASKPQVTKSLKL
jgi:hypothetical protein